VRCGEGHGKPVNKGGLQPISTSTTFLQKRRRIEGMDDKWSCKHYMFDDGWDGEDEHVVSGCLHPDRSGCGCILEEHGKYKCKLYED